jgi:hypothetical protein
MLRDIWCYDISYISHKFIPLCTHRLIKFHLHIWPYLQTSHQYGKACQVETPSLIWPICTFRRKNVL